MNQKTYIGTELLRIAKMLLADEMPEVIELRGTESRAEIESLVRKAIKLKLNLKLEYAVKKDGQWIRREIEDVPRRYGKIRGSDGYVYDGINFMNEKIIPFHLIGEFNSVVRRREKEKEDRLQRELRTGEALKSLISLYPELESHLRSSNKAGIEQAWDVINGTGSANIKLDVTREVVGGPYGSMENTKVRDVDYYLKIKSGDPLDSQRMSIEPQYGDEYWIDDEGNRSRGTSRRTRGW